MTITDSTLARIKTTWSERPEVDPTEPSSLFESPEVAHGVVSGELVLTHHEPDWRFVQAVLYIRRDDKAMATECMGEVTLPELIGLRSVVTELINQWEAAVPAAERS